MTVSGKSIFENAKLAEQVYNQRMEPNLITEYFEEVETTNEYDGYFCSVAQAIALVLLGSICGLNNVSQIHQWATNPRIS